MTNLITRTNGDPFATEANAKGARTRMGLTHTHDGIQHGGGWVLSERQSEQEQGDAAVTLRPGDYIATADLSEDDYHSVAKAFMDAGAKSGEYPCGNFFMLPHFGWPNGSTCHGCSLYHSSGSGESMGFFTRQLTLSQILGATNAGGSAEPEEPTTEQQHMPQQHLADQLEAALASLEQAQSEVGRLQAEYRAAYPKIHGEVVLSDDMSDPSNWRAGDIVECVNHGGLFGATEGCKYLLEIDPNDGELSYRDDDGDWCNLEPVSAFRFVRRP